MHETHGLQGGNELAKDVDLLLWHPPYNIGSHQNLQNSGPGEFTSKNMEAF